MPISLTKIEQQAPELVSLVKTVQVSLAKVGLDNHVARVGLCLDISGSMEYEYRSGRVQDVANKTLALATQFDDDGNIDIFTFGRNGHYVGGMDLDNFRDFIRKNPSLEGDTQYAKAIEKIQDFYFSSNKPKKGFFSRLFGRQTAQQQDNTPVYILFVTDGDNSDKTLTEQLIRESANYPIYYQFLGIGGGSFPFLDRLDNLAGREVDNTGFISVDCMANLSDDQLYTMLTAGYSQWVKDAVNKQLLAV